MTENDKSTKKRELTDDYHAIMKEMAEMLPDVIKLESNDNFEASKRLRRAIIRMRTKKMLAFQEKVKALRDQIKPKHTKIA